jgi:hypothetical protein
MSSQRFIRLIVVSTIMSMLVAGALPALAQYEDPDAINTILAQGSQGVVVQELLLNETFDDRNAWELYNDDNASADIRNGVYYMSRVDAQNTMWGQNQTVHSDVVMIYDATQVSTEDNNTFGMMCRAAVENDARGYYLRISGDGYGFIGVNRGEGMEVLVDWTPSSAIVQGQNLNRAVAVCVGDYLALYANGQLIAETTDSTFSEGVAGFSVAHYVDGANVEVEFDNLEIYSATFADAPVGPSGDGNNTAGNGIRIVPRDGGGDGDSPSETAENVVDFAVANSALSTVTSTLASSDVMLGEVLSTSTFNEETTTWELLDLKDEDALLTSRILEDRYIVYSESASKGTNEWFIDLQNRHSDAVIYARTEQISPVENNGYGIGCRGDVSNNGDGYYFRISGDGYYSIVSVLNQEFTNLVEWTRSDTIRTGQSENEMVVICVGDYLALYVNGELMAETNDDTFTQGTTSVVIVAFEDDSPTEIAYDDIVVIEASR